MEAIDGNPEFLMASGRIQFVTEHIDTFLWVAPRTWGLRVERLPLVIEHLVNDEWLETDSHPRGIVLEPRLVSGLLRQMLLNQLVKPRGEILPR